MTINDYVKINFYIFLTLISIYSFIINMIANLNIKINNHTKL